MNDCSNERGKERQTRANCVDPDPVQMLQNVSSDQGPDCLALIQQF